MKSGITKSGSRRVRYEAWRDRGIVALTFAFAAAALLALTACTSAGGPKASDMERAAAESSPMVGRQAPFFELPDQDGKTVALQGLRGQWVVLYFYPKDDTPGCTCQATEFTQLLSQFSDMNATVLGVSTDPPDSHRYFRQKYGIRFALLSDARAAVAKIYGAWSTLGFADPDIGRIVRSTVLIDPSGRVAYHWPEVIPQGHAQRVREQLARLRADK